MTSKEFALVIAAVALVCSPALVSATSDDDSTNRGPFQDIRKEYRDKVTEIRENAREEKGELKGEIKEVREESREAMKNASSSEDRLKIKDDRREQVRDLHQEKIGTYADKIAARLTAAIERSNRFIVRIETMIADWKDDGKTVTNEGEIAAKLTEAKNLIPAAESLISALPAKIEAIVASSTATSTPPRYTEIRNVVTEATQAVKNIHAKIVEAVRLIKAN